MAMKKEQLALGMLGVGVVIGYATCWFLNKPADTQAQGLGGRFYRPQRHEVVNFTGRNYKPQQHDVILA